MDPLQSADPTQVELMKEECILVNERDQVIGHASKYYTHLLENVLEDKALHRAFSVFLFDSQGRLFLQKRASEKITFPDTWTNTCCSHPLYRPEELEEQDYIGAKRAACRKLEHELGISPDTITTDDLVFLTRIIYQAPSDDQWGEHEVDYIFFAQKDIPDVAFNPNEVQEVKYVSETELRKMLKTRTMPTEEKGLEKRVLLTPWFTMIAESGLLFKWWSNLTSIMENKGLSDVNEANMIHPLKMENA